MAKILFFPSDLGGGFGHISRCLALAFEAKKRAHECVFVINDKKFEKTIRKNFDLFLTRKRFRVTDSFTKLKSKFFQNDSAGIPVFTEFSGLEFQVVRDGLTDTKKITRILNQYIKAVQKFNPDILVGDTNLLTWILSRKTGIPLVQVVRFATHPKTARLIWWKDVPAKIVPPDICSLFNPLLQHLQLPPIRKAQDLLQGNLYIIPSIPEIEPVPTDSSTFHVGELTLPEKNTDLSPWLNGIDNTLPLVYISIGGGAGPAGCKSFFSKIISAFANKKIQAIVSVSSKFKLSGLPSPPENIKLFNWVPGKQMISRADLIIFHGGYGTMMESVICGKPSIVLPFHSEQEGNGRRLQMLGSSVLMKLSSAPYHPSAHKWKYGKYVCLFQQGLDNISERLYETCCEILDNKKYLSAARTLQAKTEKHLGAQKAVDLIISRLVH